MGLTTRLGGDILGAFFSKRSGGAKPMGKISRRQLLQRASAGAAFATLGANASYSVALPPREVSSSLKPSFEWIRSIRLMIAEGYAPPFYPSLDFAPSWNVRNGWVELSIPQVHPYEVVCVDLHS